MIRVAISVEGATERDFCNKILSKYFLSKNIQITPINIKGNVSVDRAVGEINRMINNFDYVTTFYDLYGFKKNELAKTELEKKLSNEINNSKFFPYIQQYEFEALLFSDLQAFNIVDVVSESDVKKLGDILINFNGIPENINNSKDTAPSKRIKNIITRYDKVRDGVAIAEKIGLEQILQQCLLFAAWIKKIEFLK